jgi:hypothetical protein
MRALDTIAPAQEIAPENARAITGEVAGRMGMLAVRG